MEEADAKSIKAEFNAKLEALEQRMDAKLDAKLDAMFLRIAALLPPGTAPNVDSVARAAPPKSPEVPTVPKQPDPNPDDAEVPFAAFRSPMSDRNVYEVPRSSDVQFYQQTAALNRRPTKRDLFNPAFAKESDDDDEELFLAKEEEMSASERRGSLIRPTNLKGVIPSTAVSVYRDQPSFAHIKLEYMTVNQVFQFWTDILQYQTMYGIGLNATTLVGRDARLTIMSKGGIKTELEFFRLTDRQQRKYIQHAVRPTDKVMFASKLEKSLWFWPKGEDNFTLNFDTFQRFYDRLQTYRHEFYQKYEFLAYNNAENVPKLDNKEFGLIYIFLQKLPKEYGHAFTQLPKSRFDSLEEFLTMFYEQANVHYQKSIKAKELSTFFALGAKKAGAKRDDTKAKFAPRVHNVEVDEREEQDFYGENPLIPSKDPSADPNVDGEEYESSGADLNAFGGLSRGVPSRPPPKPPMATPKPPTAPKGPDGCFRALTDGKCSKPNCSFNHSLPVLEATYDELMAKMNKKLWRARPVNAIFAPNGDVESPSDKDG